MEKEEFEAKTKEIKEMLKVMIEIQFEMEKIVGEKREAERAFTLWSSYLNWQELATIHACGTLLENMRDVFEWWNWENPQKRNYEKVLDSLVDIYFFILANNPRKTEDYLLLKMPTAKEFIANYTINDLSYGSWYSTDSRNVFQNMLLIPKYPIKNRRLNEWFGAVIADSRDFKIDALLMLTKRLGYDFEEVYHAFVEKMKKNYERLSNDEFTFY